jgi:hypothetical protein
MPDTFLSTSHQSILPVRSTFLNAFRVILLLASFNEFLNVVLVGLLKYKLPLSGASRLDSPLKQ